MSSKSTELKTLLRRMKKLRDYMESVLTSLLGAVPAEMHLAVTMSTRIFNILASTFDFGLIDTTVRDDVNSRVLRLRRDDETLVSDLKSRLVQLYRQALDYLAGRMQGLAKLAAAT
jgi:hypothetical protein